MIAEVLAEKCGDLAAAKRAYDIAATAMLSRILELDRAVEEFPQLGSMRPEDVAVLADSRGVSPSSRNA